MVSLSNFLILGALLFCISVAGIFINRKNIIILLMAIELMLLAVNLNFIAFSHFLEDTAGRGGGGGGGAGGAAGAAGGRAGRGGGGRGRRAGGGGGRGGRGGEE